MLLSEKRIIRPRRLDYHDDLTTVAAASASSKTMSPHSSADLDGEGGEEGASVNESTSVKVEEEEEEDGVLESAQPKHTGSVEIVIPVPRKDARYYCPKWLVCIR